MKCPHGCRPRRDMIWSDDSWYCPQCESEWPEPADEPDRSDEEQDWIERTDRTI